MKTAIVIPSRMGSTRLPGKPLLGLKGKNGKVLTLVERCWRVAKDVDVDDVIVATDHDDIASAVRKFGGAVVLTSPFYAEMELSVVRLC